MGTFVEIGEFMWATAGQIIYPTDRGPLQPGPGIVHGKARLDDDPIGTCELTLNNIVSGSRWRIEIESTGALAASPSSDEEGVAATDPEVLTLYLYPQGNPLNDVRIKVRKASGDPRYKPFETLITLAAGGVQTGVSAFVGQIPD